jgi:hypothetical protein
MKALDKKLSHVKGELKISIRNTIIEVLAPLTTKMSTLISTSMDVTYSQSIHKPTKPILVILNGRKSHPTTRLLYNSHNNYK